MFSLSLSQGCESWQHPADWAWPSQTGRFWLCLHCLTCQLFCGNAILVSEICMKLKCKCKRACVYVLRATEFIDSLSGCLLKAAIEQNWLYIFIFIPMPADIVKCFDTVISNRILTLPYLLLIYPIFILCGFLSDPLSWFMFFLEFIQDGPRGDSSYGWRPVWWKGGRLVLRDYLYRIRWVTVCLYDWTDIYKANFLVLLRTQSTLTCNPHLTRHSYSALFYAS